MAKRVDNKLAEGDLRGAVRVLSSETGLTPFSEEVTQLLQAKHPQPTCSPTLPESASPETQLQTNEDEIRKAIASFPAGSSGGPDGIRPVHLKDLTALSAGDAG